MIENREGTKKQRILNKEYVMIEIKWDYKRSVIIIIAIENKNKKYIEKCKCNNVYIDTYMYIICTLLISIHVVLYYMYSFSSVFKYIM